MVDFLASLKGLKHDIQASNWNDLITLFRQYRFTAHASMADASHIRFSFMDWLDKNFVDENVEKYVQFSFKHAFECSDAERKCGHAINNTGQDKIGLFYCDGVLNEAMTKIVQTLLFSVLGFKEKHRRESTWITEFLTDVEAFVELNNHRLDW